MSQGGRRIGTCESGRQRDLDRWVRELEESGQVGQGAGRIWTCGSGNWKNLAGWEGGGYILTGGLRLEGFLVGELV